MKPTPERWAGRVSRKRHPTVAKPDEAAFFLYARQQQASPCFMPFRCSNATHFHNGGYLLAAPLDKLLYSGYIRTRPWRHPTALPISKA